MTAIFSKPTRSTTTPFWLSCWSARSVVVVEVNGYTIEPDVDLRGANLYRANLERANLAGADLTGTILGGVNLRGVNLAGVGDIPRPPLAL